MSDLSRWYECLRMTRGTFRDSGGCFWRLQRNSPGGHIRVPAGTGFKVRLSGPQSHDYANGTCADGLWCLEGIGKFHSANQAVAAARPQVEASNAFLYVELQVGNKWILANDLRLNPDLSLPRDEVEDAAFVRAKEIVRGLAKSQRRNPSPDEVDAEAEVVLDKSDSVWKYARLVTAPVDF